jgi:hypothetical protein
VALETYVLCPIEVEAFLCDQAKVLQDSDFVMTEFEKVQDNMRTFRKIPATGLQ